MRVLIKPFFYSTILLAGCLLQVSSFAQQRDKYAPYDNGVPKGAKLIEGDILVPVIPPPKGIYATNLWTGGVVPFEFDANVDTTNQGLMLDAMAEWEAIANVNFVARNGEADFLHIQNSTRNSSFVGRQGGEQAVNIFNWGWRFIMAHELGHALGLWHEQSRFDRDTYVTIEWDRIETDASHNFNMHATEGIFGEYDFDSVMHYGQCSFSTCADCGADTENCRTITVNPPWDTNWQDTIGQRDHFSEMDELTMWVLYPPANSIFVDKNYTGGIETGIFFQPYKHVNDGVNAVSAGGSVIIQPGSYNEVGTYTKEMMMYAPLGGVTIGN